MQDYPENIHQFYPKGSFLDIPSVIVVQEDSLDSRGSCCDDGVYRVAPCKGWWYQCKDWGIVDMVPWLKFGASGFTMPPATEHRRSCSYSSAPRVCPLPALCMLRKPLRGANGRAAAKRELCGSMPRVKYMGPPIVMPNTTVNATVVQELFLAQQKIKYLEAQVKRLKKKLRTKSASEASL